MGEFSPQQQESAVPDEVIAGYRLAKHMATGQTSQVWEVVELSSHRHFGMKLLLPERVRSPEHRRILFHEAEVARKLAHQNIIKVVVIIREGDNPCFVMEFFPAGSLRDRLVDKVKGAPFLREKLPDLLKQAALALAFTNAHGWVHRDVKPDNFLANSAGDLRLIDFALATRIQKGGGGLIAKIFGRKEKTMGTRSYMSPEQILGNPLDGRADIYSFGATCYELVTGRPPFRGMSSDDLLKKHLRDKPVSPRDFNPDLTEEFAALVLRMLNKRREERPKDFHEILMALRGLQVYKPNTSAKPGEAPAKSE
jgi:serine/threonine protein kinase